MDSPKILMRFSRTTTSNPDTIDSGNYHCDKSEMLFRRVKENDFETVNYVETDITLCDFSRRMPE